MSKGIKRKLDTAYKNLNNHIGKSGSDGNNVFARGLASEGYAGGYRDALLDVMTALNGITPTRNGWWSDEKNGDKPNR